MKTIVKTQTTGIGSLPHHNVDAALEYSFKMGVPFLPQIPIRNAWEFMIAQALEGLPGLQLEPEGVVTLSPGVWQSQSHRLAARLEEAFAQAPANPEAFHAFEPSSSTSSCWQPFLWELQERKIRVAKMQIAGPITSQWALRLTNGSTPDHYPELATQVFRLVLARSLAMVKRMLSLDIQPVFFLDEPGLYALSLSQPRFVFGLQELKLVIQTLRKEGARVGLHCCSNTDWKAVLGLGMDILSIDTGLSLRSALQVEDGQVLENFVESGGQLSLGVIPTVRTSVLRGLEGKELGQDLITTLKECWGSKPELVKKVLQESLYTPACGLAFQSTSDAELILEKLVEVYEFLHFQ